MKADMKAAAAASLPGNGCGSSSSEVGAAQLQHALARMLAFEQQQQQQQQQASSLSMSLSDWAQQLMQGRLVQQNHQVGYSDDSRQSNLEGSVQHQALQAADLQQQHNEQVAGSGQGEEAGELLGSSSMVDAAAGAAAFDAAGLGMLPMRGRQDTSGGGSSVESHPIDESDW
jgi:hypothetical protein